MRVGKVRQAGVTGGKRAVRLGCTFVAAIAAFGSGGTERAVHAQVVGAQAPPIVKNDYSLEFFQGPVIAPNRVTALGGAYTAFAEGFEGLASNAASPAVREQHSTRWFDLDVGVSASLPGGYAGVDFNNRGEGVTGDQKRRTNRFIYGLLGGRTQFGQLGLALSVEALSYQITQATDDAAGLSLTYLRFHALAAYGFFNNQLVLGGGLRGIALRLSDAGPASLSGDLLTLTGAAPQAGFLLKLNNSPFRVGGTFRATVSGAPLGDSTSRATDGVIRAGTFIAPQRIVLPWELEVGFAWQFGPRPMNAPFIEPDDHIAEFRAPLDREREKRQLTIRGTKDEAERQLRIREDKRLRAEEDVLIAEEAERLRRIRKARFNNWPRDKLLLLGSVLMTGASNNAVALEGFLDQRLETVGQAVTLSPRGGLEAEVLRDRLRVRAGGYIEPSRFSDGHVREHFTAGLDVKLFEWDLGGLFPEAVWQASTMVDLSARYQNYGLGVSIWH